MTERTIERTAIAVAVVVLLCIALWVATTDKDERNYDTDMYPHATRQPANG